jgi:hypothetical protein
MIPKIIHYCWLSNDPFPKEIARCLESWRKPLADYEIWLWDLNRFPIAKSSWVKAAFDNRKYAFAADYIRSYALYNYGGIYLDSDVEVLRSYDAFLQNPYMISYDSGGKTIEAACIGAEKGHPLFAKLLEYYDSRDFIKADGSFDMVPMPTVMQRIIEDNYTVKNIDTVDEFDGDPKTLCILPSDYFSPIDLETMELKLTKRTVSIHRLAASWESNKHRLRKRVQLFVGPKVTSAIIKLKTKLRHLC